MTIETFQPSRFDGTDGRPPKTGPTRSDRIRAGLEGAKALGVRLGGPRPGSGRPRVAIDVERALALRAEGRTLAAIGRSLGVSAMTVSRALAGCATVATKINIRET